MTSLKKDEKSNIGWGCGSAIPMFSACCDCSSYIKTSCFQNGFASGSCFESGRGWGCGFNFGSGYSYGSGH